jgi:outer membrane protein
MKKSLSILFALVLASPLAAFAQGTLKIGTVDMQRAFKEYNKTKEAEAKINDAKNSARKEYDDRAQDYKKALDEINNLNKQLESPALSADKKTQTAKDRDDKISKIKSMEREISDFRQTRERHRKGNHRCRDGEGESQQSGLGVR